MSRWQFCIVLLIGCCFSLAERRCQAQSSSQDAMTVRAIYAKLEMASHLQELRNGLGNSSSTKASMNSVGSLHFVLSDIKTGSINDIRSLPLVDLVTKPSGRTLLVTPSQWNFMTAGSETLHAMTALISWADSPYLAEDWNIPVSRAIGMGVIDPAYSRYASFTVRAIYQGEQRQYQALFLFSGGLEKQSAVLPLDHVVGLPALQTLSADQSVPEPLLAQPFRGRPEVSNFIEWWRGQVGCSTDAHTGMCCDPSTGQCGVSSRVLQMKGFGAIQTPSVLSTTAACEGTCASRFNTLTAIGDYGDFDTTGHSNPQSGTSYHRAEVGFNGQCSYNGVNGNFPPCRGICEVFLSHSFIEDKGPVATACHVLSTNFSGTTTPAGSGNCSGTWGYTVRACNLCTCGSNAPLHSWEHTAQWSCPVH